MYKQSDGMNKVDDFRVRGPHLVPRHLCLPIVACVVRDESPHVKHSIEVVDPSFSVLNRRLCEGD